MNRYDKDDLIKCGTSLLQTAGMEADKAAVTARLLLEADLLGHSTHGFQLLGPYIKSLQSGDIVSDGEPDVLRDTGNSFHWDGKFLPGIWLTDKAIQELMTRVGQYGVVTASIRQSSHIGCLQVFLQQVTERDCMIFLSCSDPYRASIAPYGGITAVYTPNPIAMGIPTDSDPILVDTSLSICSNGQTMRALEKEKSMPGEWILTADGKPTNDPAELFTENPGTILPVGGVDHGFKGFGMALMIEALTQGLSDYNRISPPDRWAAGVFIQIIDPDVFGGKDALKRQSSYLIEQCLASTPQLDYGPVRIPGQNALRKKRDALKKGIQLEPDVEDALTKWTLRLKIDMPKPI
ncbi:Ldh family oxidoreductase [bacterium AH-315-E10]|nr:Ldh family oxidoreductase [bacterium AH-315-E10]